jgi:hypothetical protein
MNFPSPQQLPEAIPYEQMHVLEIEDTHAGKHMHQLISTEPAEFSALQRRR